MPHDTDPQSGTSTGSSTISGETIYLPPASYDESTPAADTSLSSNKFTLPDGLFMRTAAWAG